MRTSRFGGSTSIQAFFRTLQRWYIAASATGSTNESALKALSRAAMVLRPPAAILFSKLGYTSEPACVKISSPAEIIACSAAATARGSWPSMRRMVGRMWMLAVDAGAAAGPAPGPALGPDCDAALGDALPGEAP